MTKITAICLIIIFQSVSIAGSCKDIDSLSWMLGDWIYKNKSTVTTESWSKVSNKSFEGYGLTRINNETRDKNFESLRILEMSDNIYYLAKVEHNHLPIAFELTECSDSLAVFENPDHDFPKKIAYQLGESDQLSVTASSEERSFTLHFKKNDVKENQHRSD